MADIFDKIADGINKGVATVGVGSKAMVGKAKVKTVINNIENERKRNAEQLGMLVYDRFIESGQTPDDEAMAAFVAKISECLVGIEQQHEELKRIEEEAAQVSGQRAAPVGAPPVGASIICSCGYENESDAKFCAACGSPPVASSKSCPCGFENELSAKFCAVCGNPL